MTEIQSTHVVVSGTTVWQRREVDGYLVASCPSLRILVWGETAKELEEKQQKAVILTIFYLYGQGILGSFLEKRGFSVEVNTVSTFHLPSWPEPSPSVPHQSSWGLHVQPSIQYEYA